MAGRKGEGHEMKEVMTEMEEIRKFGPIDEAAPIVSSQGMPEKVGRNPEPRIWATDVPREFTRWIPEVDARLFRNFKVLKIELTVLGKDEEPVIFRFDNSNPVRGKE
jgi:hypothetical protein